MGFLDSIEKLINEHGSAVILKERIHLLNDQHADLQRKLEESEKAASALKARNAELQSEITEVQRRYDEIHKRLEEQSSQGSRLPEERERVAASGVFA